MLSTRAYIEQHGKPLAFYSDKHSVFRVNQSSKKETKITQFGRVLSSLNIDIIFANSPQAKGRVAHIQLQHEELEQQNQRNRSQKMPSRRAQKTAIQERN